MLVQFINIVWKGKNIGFLFLLFELANNKRQKVNNQLRHVPETVTRLDKGNKCVGFCSDLPKAFDAIEHEQIVKIGVKKMLLWYRVPPFLVFRE